MNSVRMEAIPTERQNDFSKGKVSRNILNLALPMTLAQLINVLYSVVDRMYIGHIPEAATLALTGLGLTFPIISIITAFANLFGMGGAPLCSIARGKGDDERAETIMGNSFFMMVATGLVLTALFLAFKGPLLRLFGASGQTFPYADGYLTVYLCGSVFVMVGLGMNSFINSQGFGKMGMMTVLLGAVTNILLDPLFIFVLHMGVQGAALATVISQFLSAAWVVRFLTSKKAIYRLQKKTMKLDWKLVGEIVSLGMSSFCFAITNSLVQIVCNINLQQFGGDLYVGIMTVANSVREVVSMPMNGLTNGAQPVIGFNYGAREYRRVRSGIRFMSVVCVVYTLAAWLVLMLFPQPFIHLFSSDPDLVGKGAQALGVYFFGYFMMAFQMAGQSTFVALGRSKQAVFFSLLRKAIIVVPLTILLPRIGGLGVIGVFLAEPVSNFVGGSACYLTMLATVWKPLRKAEEAEAVPAGRAGE
ncbi:MATE family efflux transporter [Bittarella massiliensis]|uniref:MATE family efflux transporter n=1 Tax=Bittarella massiliensis (ex Durand et al. 2017) TaxID=1720313 RepID=UPI00163CFFF3|nr:MATE family efflux transporter [Bittarella massiliensis (ex Durand et al. 2017)]MBC2870466.1 MATE family efflux transporter [Bittarella massiliensis (ex Durand et al. 2017)]